MFILFWDLPMHKNIDWYNFYFTKTALRSILCNIIKSFIQQMLCTERCTWHYVGRFMQSSEGVYQFSIAAITTYRKYSGSKQFECVILQLWKSDHRFCWAKIKVSSGGLCCFLDALEKKSVLLSFPAPRGCLHSLALSPLPLSSKSAILHIPLP